MKKLLIGSFMIFAVGSTAFAGMHHNGYGNGDYKKYHCSPNIERAEFHKKSFEFKKLGVSLDEKRLELRKELLNEKPDWNKIEKINNDIALEKSKFKTKMMKERFERQEKFVKASENNK